MPPGLLQDLFAHANRVVQQSESTWQPRAPLSPLSANVDLVVDSSSSPGWESPHSPAFSPTKEDVDFVRRYTLDGRAIAFRRAQDAARPGTAKRGLLGLAPLKPPQKSAGSQLLLPFKRAEIFGPSAICGGQADPPPVGSASPSGAATP